MNVTGIKIQIKDNEIELSVSEARQLRDRLSQVLGDNEQQGFTFPSVRPLPDLYPKMPYWWSMPLIAIGGTSNHTRDDL